jgi:hypothetical protein
MYFRWLAGTVRQYEGTGHAGTGAEVLNFGFEFKRGRDNAVSMGEGWAVH